MHLQIALHITPCVAHVILVLEALGMGYFVEMLNLNPAHPAILHFVRGRNNRMMRMSSTSWLNLGPCVAPVLIAVEGRLDKGVVSIGCLA